VATIESQPADPDAVTRDMLRITGDVAPDVSEEIYACAAHAR
jgi:hypothetical protein